MKATLFVILVNKRDELVIIQPRVFVVYVKNLKYNVQKQFYIGVLRKRCSENMQQIYRRYPCRSGNETIFFSFQKETEEVTIY